MKGKKKTSLIHKDGFTDFASSIIAIIIGLFVGFIVLLVSNPRNALGGIGSILVGGFSDMKSLGQVLYFATPIILTGLSVGFANKTGLFNIGASGQFIVGAYAAVLVGNKVVLPGFLHCLLALLCALVAGAIWASVPGILKAFLNVNEVISCIMMNYIGMSLVNFLVKRTVFDSRTNTSLRVAESANLPKLGMDKIFRLYGSASSANAGIFVAIIVGILMYIVLEKTRFGYELKACGYNRDAARYAGINENKSIVFSMLIAGALSGLGGALLYLAGSGKGIEVLDVLASEGFNGIPVALLGLNNPIGIIFSGLFVAHLDQGGFNMQIYNYPPQIIEIIIAVIIYFSAFSLLFKDKLASFISKRFPNNRG